MPKETLEISAPIEEVWSLLTDPRRMPEYGERIALAEVVSGDPLGLGTYALRLHLRAAVRPQIVITEVKEWDPPKRIASTGRVGLLAWNSHVVLTEVAESVDFRTAAPTRVRLEYDVTYRLGGPIVWILAPFMLGAPFFMVRQASRQVGDVFASMKRRAEAIAR
jgi:uncharacterized protein YndB with AHSA1/START domain